MYIKQIKIDIIPEKLSNSVFNSKRWVENVYNPSNIKTHGIYNKNEELIGYFFTYHTQKLKFLKHITTPPYSPHFGLTYINPSENKAKQTSFDKKIITCVSNYINKQKAQIKTIALPQSVNYTLPFYWDKFKVVPNYTYLCDLTQKEEGLISAMDPKIRSAIKKV